MATTANISTSTPERRELKYKEIIRELQHVPDNLYKWLKKLQRAVECKGRIPKSCIYDEDYCIYEATYADCFNIDHTKRAARETRQQLIDEIVYTISSGKMVDGVTELMPDNYARLFHALTILKLPKETELFSGTTKNLSFDAIYMLWRLDDGSEQTAKSIQSAAWYMAEELKRRSGKGSWGYKCLIPGIKC